jgi:hypothetical protein
MPGSAVVPDHIRVRQYLRIGTREYASMGNIFLLKRAKFALMK